MLRATDIGLTFRSTDVKSIHYLGGIYWWCLPFPWPWSCWSGWECRTWVPALPTASLSARPARDLEVKNKTNTSNICSVKRGKWHIINLIPSTNGLMDKREDLTGWGSSPCRCFRSGCTESVWWGGCCGSPLVCRCPARRWGPRSPFPSSSHWTAWTGPSWTELRGCDLGIKKGSFDRG